MSNQPASREELYNQIRSTGRDAYTRKEMISLGFWSEADEKAHGIDPADRNRQGELHRELRALYSDQNRLEDKTALLNAIRKQKIEESRQRRKETLLAREEQKRVKKEQWQERQSHEITYLGEEHSAQLNHLQNNTDILSSNNLPIFETVESLADTMGVTLSELRFLTFTRKSSEVTHYSRFFLPKKSGGKRLISAPKPKLKQVQYWILEHILKKVKIHEAAKGFVEKESIITNATPHVNKRVVINLDLENFFPTISYKRVYGQFKALGYSPAISTILALLTTEPEVKEVTLDNKKWYLSQKERFLPQGAPTSPALTNILCRRLDRKLQKLADNMDYSYSRYADDLSFSSDDDTKESVGKLLRRVKHLVTQEGFIVHPRKTRVLRKGRRQEVTGLTVNEKVSIDRKMLRKFRAVLFQIEKDGPEGKVWGNGDNLMRSIVGYANYINMVNPQKGRELCERAQQLAKKYGTGSHSSVVAVQPEKRTVQEPQSSEPIIEENKKDKEWWKLW